MAIHPPMKTLTERTADALAWIDSQLAICNAATRGPWIHDVSRGTIGDVITADSDAIAQAQQRIDTSGHGNERQTEIRNKNAAFIAAARTGYPAMLESMKLAIETISYTQIDINQIGTLEKILEIILTRIEALQ